MAEGTAFKGPASELACAIGKFFALRPGLGHECGRGAQSGCCLPRRLASRSISLNAPVDLPMQGQRPGIGGVPFQVGNDLGDEHRPVKISILGRLHSKMRSGKRQRRNTRPITILRILRWSRTIADVTNSPESPLLSRSSERQRRASS